MDVAIVDYGAGNTHSVRAVLERLGHEVELTSEPTRVERASYVVLPGVGSARAAMEHLNETGAADALRCRFEADGPILGICLGMQLAVAFSEEDGGVEGLGLLPGRVSRLATSRIPRLGWATVEPWGDAFYFAHSFAVDSETVVATSEGVTAAIARGSFKGVQFHPEKSGPAGERWMGSCLIPA